MKSDTHLDRPNRSARQGVLARDDRAVSPLLGAILLFALLLALLVLIQVTAVPGWNQQVEYEHSQRVEQDMRGFDAAAADAAQRDRSGAAVIENGVEYPTRPFLFNPSDPTGTTETTADADLRIRNANITGVDTVWTDGNSPVYDTQTFQYVSGYNEYANAPLTRWENGYLYNEYDGTVVPLTETSLVDGREVNIVTLDGRVSSTRRGASTVTLEPLAGEARPVSIQSDNGSDIVLTFPTKLDQAAWETALADELDGGAVGTDDDPDAYIADLTVTPGTPYNTLRIRLEAGSGDLNQYQLRMGKVGLDGTGEPESAHYLALESQATETIDEGETSTITVQVRNRYNNPVQGETVTFDRTLGGGVFVGESGSSVTVTTGSNGKASVRFRADDGLSRIRISGDLDDSGTVEPREQTTVSITGESLGGDDDPTDNDDSINPAGIKDVQLLTWDYDNVGCGPGKSAKDCRINATFRNNDLDDDRTIVATRVNFLFVTQSSGGVSPPAYGVFENSNGQMEIRGPYDSLNATEQVTIANQTTDGISLRFYDEDDDPVDMDGQRYLLAITFAYDNGRTGTYFITND